MNENCEHNCSSCGADCAKREPGSFMEQPHELSQVQRVIAVVSGKGGVGKSLASSLLAVGASRRGYRVGILDADVTGPSIPKAFGITQKADGDAGGIFPVASATGIQIMSINLLLADETAPVIWRGPMIAGAVRQFWTDVAWGDLDVLFIDMPPGTGDVPLTVFQSIPVDGAVIVTSPQSLVGMIVEKAIHMVYMMQVPVLGLVENMSYINCPDCGKRIEPFGVSRLAECAKTHQIPATAQLPIDPALAAACDAGTVELCKDGWLDGILDAVGLK